MLNARGIARVGILAVGLGIGAAVAAVPGTAAADSSSDWLSSLDTLLSSAALPAADSSGVNFAISEDGVTLFQEGSAVAHSGTTGDIAIADGADTTAYAYGTDNYADVLGTDSTGVAGGTTAASALGSTGDTAYIDGNNDTAFAGGTDAVDDASTITGNGDSAISGSTAAGTGSYDVAYVEGNDLGTANASGADYLVDVLKNYGDATSAAASESSNLLTGADSGNLLADLVSAFDPGAATADSGNFLTELASLF
jgi:hypothetical protein